MVAKPFRLDYDTPLIPEEDPNVFYPEDDDEPIAENDWQRRVLIDTSETLIRHYAGRPDVYVSADMFIYYEMNNPDRRITPDVFVSLGVSDHWRGSYFVWREGKPPDFVLEIAAPGVYVSNATDKRNTYAAIGVTEYWQFDPNNGVFFWPLLSGERLDSQGNYQPIPLAEVDGILSGHSEALGLDLCVVDGQLKLYDPISQTWLRNLREEIAAHRIAEERSRAAQERTQLLEQLLREHGITPPNGG